jgi:hypothetical protein
MKPELKRLIAGLGIALIAVAAWFIGRARIVAPNPQADQLAREMATLPFEKKQWYEIRREAIASQSIDLRGSSGWLHDPIPPNGNLKQFLVVQCAASEADRVLFVVMDEQNLERMQAGYPPLPLASRPVKGTAEIEVPYGRRYWFGFVELASKPAAPGTIPTSTLGAAIYVFNEYQKRNRPPIRLTAEIYQSVRMYTTITDARRQMIALKQNLGQPSNSSPPVPPSPSSNLPQTADENELRAIENVRVIATAVSTYCNAYSRPPGSLADLASSNLINADLASGQTPGYKLDVQAIDCELYGVVARPLVWNAGFLNLYLDETGTLHASRENRPAMRTDPVLATGGQ